jgi:dTDP-4-amino-4,6-dideoxygalactose transaminase
VTFRVPITRPALPALGDYVGLLEGVWASRMLSNFGALATALEDQCRAYLDAGYVLSASSGDVAVTLAIRALDLPPGSGVLVPSFTFNSTVNAILWNGLRPVFVDIDPETLTIDPADARRSAGDARAIVATHVFGVPAAVGQLSELASDLGARLVFDAAHGYGSLVDGRHVGTFGDAEVFSLSGTKPVTSGEGGLFTTADPNLAERFRYLRAYGFQGDYNSRFVGLNGKLSELHAALGLLTMARIEESLAIRARHVEAYLAGIGAIRGVTVQRVPAGTRSTYKDFAVLFADHPTRDRVEAALTADGVQTKRYFRPCHTMDAYRAYADRPLPVTEDVYDRILCLPLFEDLADADRDRIVAVVERAARPMRRAATRARLAGDENVGREAA